jgi:Luciferase-like monooxygenase
MVETSRNLGIFLLGDLPPAQIAETAQLVEEAGFKELWIIEDYFMLSALATSGIALQATKTIKVGIGAIANRVRHPAVAAMEATTLAGAFPGRFLNLGLGHGLPFWMKQLDLYPKSPLTSMTEAVRDVKRLAQGETLTEKGAAFYLRALGPTLLTEVYGVNEELKELIKKGGADTIEKEMPDEWLDWLGVAGSPAEAASSITALFDAGSTSVALCIVPTEELRAQLKLIGREILPLVN